MVSLFQKTNRKKLIWEIWFRRVIEIMFLFFHILFHVLFNFLFLCCDAKFPLIKHCVVIIFCVLNCNAKGQRAKLIIRDFFSNPSIDTRHVSSFMGANIKYEKLTVPILTIRLVITKSTRF